MAGKTTYLKQLGLLVIYAHIGSYVPARVASLGLLSRICCHFDSNDSLEKASSSFSKEMVDLASVMSAVSSGKGASLVLVDELGRSTSCTDGFSIAWAAGEHLAKTPGVFVLFSTHFPGLRHLERIAPR